MASAKVLRQAFAWSVCVCGTARKPVWLQHSEIEETFLKDSWLCASNRYLSGLDKTSS